MTGGSRSGWTTRPRPRRCVVCFTVFTDWAIETTLPATVIKRDGTVIYGHRVEQHYYCDQHVPTV